jgi:hypothetical protein
MKAFKSKLNQRVQKGNLGVTIDELIEAGEIQIEILNQNLVFPQMPNGNFQFTVSWHIPCPDFYNLYNGQGYTYMHVEGIPSTGITGTIDLSKIVILILILVQGAWVLQTST